MLNHYILFEANNITTTSIVELFQRVIALDATDALIDTDSPLYIGSSLRQISPLHSCHVMDPIHSTRVFSRRSRRAS